MKKILFMGCDITLAVRQQMLITEARPDEECQKKIWQPTKELLRETLKVNPKHLICSAGLPYPCQKGGGLGIDINFVTPDKRVAYLCSVIDKNEAKAVWSWHVVKLKNLGNSLSIEERNRLITLKMQGWKVIIRETFRLSVPVDADKLDEHALKTGIIQYISQFLKEPEKCAIVWIPPDEQKLLEREIWERAVELAGSNLSRKNTLRVIRRNKREQ